MLKFCEEESKYEDLLSLNDVNTNKTSNNNINAPHNKYVDFVNKLSRYIGLIKSHQNQKINYKDYLIQISKIIHEYIYLNVEFLVDLSHVNPFNKTTTILSSTKIICMSTETLFNDVRESSKLQKYSTNDGSINTKQSDYNAPLWIAFNNDIIIGFDLKNKKFIKKYSNNVKDIYGRGANIFTGNKNAYGKINNITSICLKHSCCGSCYPFVIYLCYNDNYGIDNFVYSDNTYCRESNEFSLISEQHWVGTQCTCNYIISELYCIMGWISSASVGEHMITHADKYKKYNSIVLYEYDYKSNYFKQIINKFESIDDIEWEYVCSYLKKILAIFDENKHIVLNQDNECWMVYLPMNIYKNYEKYKMNQFESSMDQLYDTIEINSLKYLYRMTKKYILFFGQREMKKNDSIMTLVNIDCSVLNVLNQFDCVLNDYFNQRFLVSSDSMLYQFN